jgi:PAS domain S-box-containing protein
MNLSQRSPGTPRVNSELTLALAAALAAAIFAIDAFTPLDAAIAVLYVAVVMLASATVRRRHTLWAGAACAALTVLACLISYPQGFSDASIARTGMSLVAIAATTWIALRNVSYTATLLNQVQMLHLTHDAIILYDMKHVVTFWSRGAQALYGFTNQQAVGATTAQLIKTEFPGGREAVDRHLLAHGLWEGELVQTCHDGSQVRVTSRRSLCRDEQGRPLAVLAINKDITEGKNTEDALARSEAFLADAQRLSHTGSIGLKMPAEEMFWSIETYRILGYEPAETPSFSLIMQRVHPDDIERVNASRERLLAGAPHIEVEHRLSMPDGSIKHVVFVGHSQRTGDEVESVGALMDVTAARLTQEALHRSMSELAHVTRMTTLGELAASIAHEVSQPMAAIVTNGDASLRWLRRATPNHEEACAAIENMIRDARRSSDVVRRIRAMAQKRGPQQAIVPVNGIIEESADLIRRELANHRVALTLELDEAAPAVCGDRVQLQQVVINLLMNGIQAMAGNTDRPRRMLLRSELSEPGQVVVTVRDSGAGISPDEAEQLFSAFFTTKPDGMGMGLSICRAIVEAHEGRIWASPGHGSGATMHFSLPLCG